MNPLQIEQMKRSLASWISILHRKDSISTNTHERSHRRVRRKPHRQKNKPQSLCFISMVTYQEHCCSYDFGRRWPRLN